MLPIMTMAAKAGRIYEQFCAPVCREYRLSQTAFDVLLFLANNENFNTARDIFRMRGIKSGIVSVTVENLIRVGYLRRENDPKDRRIQRLILLPESAAAIEAGKRAQAAFFEALMKDILPEEREVFAELTGKLIRTIDQLDAGEKKL